VEFNGHMSRVQVKSTWSEEQRHKGYRFPTCTWHRQYRAQDVDFIAAYVAPKDTWYIVPMRAIVGQTRMRIGEKENTPKYKRYREAWKLLIGNR
jgi:PD-(D/E)XK endonuclease